MTTARLSDAPAGAAGARPFDLVIVGGGSGGYVAAIRATQLGLHTVLVEKERPGGVCLSWGCIPTKAMLRSAEVFESMQRSADYGVLADNVRLDYAAVLQRKDRIVRTLTDGVAALLRSNGVTVISGHARLVDATTVEVVAVGDSPLGPGGPLYNAPPAPGGKPLATVIGRDLIIATGSTPASLAIPGSGLAGVVSSDGGFRLENAPRRAVIIGGSAVGAEFASLFSAFGAEVTVVELLETLVPAEDTDIGAVLTRSFRQRGISVRTSSRVSRIESIDSTGSAPLRAHIAGGGGEQPTAADADVVMVAVGRRPNLAGLDLERVGVVTDQRGFISVDDQMRTSVAHVYAVGDVTGHALLAHVASHQGRVAAAVIAGDRTARMDYKAVPAATFTHPEIASVGLTERAARSAGHDVVVARFPFAALGRAQTFGATEGMVKIVADRRYGELLGVHIVGPDASDLIAEGVLALNLEATLTDLADSIHAHPTLAEGTMEASMVALGLPVHTARPAAAAVAPA